MEAQAFFAPQNINRIFCQWLQLDTLDGQGGIEPGNFGDRMQPWIVTDDRRFAEVVNQPFSQSLSRQKRNFKRTYAGLGFSLHCVAAIDEQRRGFAGRNCDAG